MIIFKRQFSNDITLITILNISNCKFQLYYLREYYRRINKLFALFFQDLDEQHAIFEGIYYKTYVLNNWKIITTNGTVLITS